MKGGQGRWTLISDASKTNPLCVTHSGKPVEIDMEEKDDHKILTLDDNQGKQF